MRLARGKDEGSHFHGLLVLIHHLKRQNNSLALENGEDIISLEKPKYH
jgi:hypothetical protein